MLKLKIHSFIKTGDKQYNTQIMIYDSKSPSIILGVLSQEIKDKYKIEHIKKDIKEKFIEWQKANSVETIKSNINQCLIEIETEI